MKKRDFLKTGSVLALGTLIVPNASCKQGDKKSNGSEAGAEFTLPDLPYAHDALQPHIDTQTMQIHHGKHHAGYVKKLNNALDGHDLKGQSLNDILMTIGKDDTMTGIRNNGGGHYNHSLFWKVMKPGGGSAPEGVLADAINAAFGSVDAFNEAFSKAAATRFGSGWAWLSVDGEGQLFVSSTPNQDNPLMTNIVDRPGTPILGIDVWEHAYYLNYQNRRKDYISNFMSIINWEQVAANLASIG